MTTLGEYIDKMRQRHPRLSRREMSLGAGLSQSLIAKIITEDAGARPETLRKIADSWGNDDDYIIMMELAGHPLPDVEFDLGTAMDIIRQNADRITPREKEQLVLAIVQDQTDIYAIARLLQEDLDDESTAPTNLDPEYLKNLSYGEILEIIAGLSPDDRQRWLAQSVRWLQRLRRNSSGKDDNASGFR
jgi:hypothetical protein